MDAAVNKPRQNAKSDLDANRPTREEAEAAVRTLLSWIGDDPDREGLVDTPKRVLKAYAELFEGYDMAPDDILARTFDDVGGYDDIVVVRDIPFYSHCEHHMVLITGRVHIAYYPDGGVLGLSKFARLVNAYSRRLQTQENLTAQISDAIVTHLKPRGLAIKVEAEHQCMTLRGVQKTGSTTVTTHFSGRFKDNPAEQTRFLSLLKNDRN